MARVTHKQKMLAILKDGRPHTHLEFYHQGIMAHCRSPELRDEGHDIRVWREDGLYLYQLVVASTAGGMEPSPAVDGAPRDNGVPGESLTSPSPASEGVSPAAEGAPSGQLVFELPARLREEAA